MFPKSIQKKMHMESFLSIFLVFQIFELIFIYLFMIFYKAFGILHFKYYFANVMPISGSWQLYYNLIICFSFFYNSGTIILLCLFSEMYIFFGI